MKVTRESKMNLELFDAPVIRSIYESQDDILNAILKLHCKQGFDCDMTYGNGSFWKTIPRPVLCYDVQPQKPEAVQGDSRALPIESECLNSIVFDPPFLTYVKGGRDHKEGKVAMTARFGGYWSYDELEDHYRDTISEAWRILKKGGHFVFKCQDIIHNHKMHCTHYNTIAMAENEGFRLADLFILAAKHRMPSPQKGQQKHARIFHSYFLVFQKPKR